MSSLEGNILKTLEKLHQLVENCVKLCKMEKGDHFTQYEQKKDPHHFGQTCV